MVRGAWCVVRGVYSVLCRVLRYLHDPGVSDVLILKANLNISRDEHKHIERRT